MVKRGGGAGSPLDRAVALHGRAQQAVFRYRFDQARSMLAKAAVLLDTWSEPAQPHAIEVRIRVLVTSAYVEAETASLTEGLAILELAAGLAAGLPSGPLRNQVDALVLQQQALLLDRGGLLEDALRSSDAALRPLTRSVAEGYGDPNVLAGLLLNRSLAYIGLGRPSEAAQECRECLRVCERYGEELVAAKAHHNLGYIDYMVGDMVDALRNYAAADHAYRVLAPSALPVLRMDHGRAMLAAGLAEDAAAALDDALLSLRRQQVGQDVAESEVARAAAALLAGQVTLARRMARSAQRRFERRGNVRWAAIAELAALRADATAALESDRVPGPLPARAVKLAETLRGLLLQDETALALMLAARLELRRGRRAVAAGLLEQVRSPRATAPVDHRMLLRLCRAELAAATGDTRRALAEARAGLTELGRARDRMGGLEMVCGTAIHGLRLGEFAIRLVLAGRTDPRRLFGWLERTRAQVYRYEPVPHTVDGRAAEQIGEIRRLRRAVQLERLAGRPARRESGQVAALERDVVRQGSYASSWIRPRPVATLAEVAAELGDRALISFAVSDDELVAVVLAAGRVRQVRLGSASVATESARRLHADLDALAPDGLPAPIAEVVAGSAARSAAAIDRQLSPLWTMVGDRELVVVPTGALYAVPWGVLASSRGRPVAVAPSATAWLAARRAPTADGPVLLITGLTEQGAEGEELHAVYPDATRLTGPAATAGAVLDGLDGARIAHLAAHGGHEPGNALFSRLELADGPMFAHELSRLRRPPEQVVLAACELALNHVRPGDEALGYAGALLAGGVRTVVAAVSRVGDAEAADAMVQYHRLVQRGITPAAALAESVAAQPFRRPFVCLGVG